MPVDVRDERGDSAIVSAAANGHTQVFDLLLQAGATWEPNDAILCWASLGACDDIVQRLLEQGVDPNEPDKDQMTPLIRASMQGHVPVVRRLLAAGADPSVGVRNWIFGPKGGKTALE
jgi:ankyrin repeat protein